jgi:hypothetical protein
MSLRTPVLPTAAGNGANEKLTVSELCAELKVSRSTFYDWRQKGRGPRCIRPAQRRPADPPPGPGRVARRAGDRVTRRAPVPAPPGGDGQRQTSYDVRIWSVRIVSGARGRTYQHRWSVAGKVHYATFPTRALASSHEAKLKTAAREGQAFDIAAGLPLSLLSDGRDREVSWYAFACSFVDMKWQEMAPNSRRAIADALATATPALLATSRGAPRPAELRSALYSWAFNAKTRAEGVPLHLAATIGWLERNTVPLSDLGDTDTLRKVLNQLAQEARRQSRGSDRRGAQARGAVQPARLRGRQEALLDEPHAVHALEVTQGRRVHRPAPRRQPPARPRHCSTPSPPRDPWGSTWRRSSDACTTGDCDPPRPSC